MKEQPTDPFLSDSQRAECRQLADAAIKVHSQRAQALILIDGGATHREAALQVALTIGQVRYALIRFRKFGMAMFPPLPEEEKQMKKKKTDEKKAKKTMKKKEKKSEKRKESKKKVKEKKKLKDETKKQKDKSKKKGKKKKDKKK